MRGSAQRVTGRTWNHSSGRCTSRLKSSSTWPKLSWSKPCKTSPETSVTSTATWWYWSFSGQATNSIFFVSFFVQKHWFAWRSNQWSLVGRKHFYLPFLPVIPLSLSWNPSRAFWADTAPFKSPQLASCAASGTKETQGHRHLCCARRRGPRTQSKTADTNLDCAFVESVLFYTPILDDEKSTE